MSSCKVSGQAFGIALKGHYAYIATPNAYQAQLKVIDVRDPASPELFKSVDTKGLAREVKVEGNFAYVLCTGKWKGIDIFDVHSPENPVHVSSYSTEYDPQGLHVTGERAYFIMQGTVHVLDLKDPREPLAAGSFGDVKKGTAISTDGDILVVVSWAGFLTVFDSSRPTPALVGTLHTVGSACGVCLSNEYAYVASSRDGFRVIDLSNPSMPRLTGDLKNAGKIMNVTVKDGLAYLAAYDRGLLIVDVNDPSRPRVLGQSRMPGRGAMDITVEGAYAFVANDGGGLQIFDIRHPCSPEPHPEERYFPTEHLCSDVAVIGRKAYLAAGQGGLQVVDLETMAGPAVPEGEGLPRYTTYVEAYGNLLFTGSSERELFILDATNPDALVTVGQYPVLKSVEEVQVKDGLLFVASFGGIQIIDISNPGEPVLIGEWLRKGSELRGLQVVGSHIFAADQDRGLIILDTSDPREPLEISSRSVPSRTIDWKDRLRTIHRTSLHVSVKGDYAYVAAVEGVGNGGVQVFDISDLYHPNPLQWCKVGGSATDIHVSGNHLYVADHVYGLREFDLAQPGAPSRSTGYPTKGHPWNFQIMGGKALVADDLGMAVVTLREPVKLIPTPGEKHIHAYLPELPRGSYHVRIMKQSGEEMTFWNSLTTPFRATWRMRLPGQ